MTPSDTRADNPVRVGDVLHGFCGGVFGRDSYECRRVEAVGADWLVCRVPSDHSLNFASGRDVATRLVEYRSDFTFCDHEEPWQL